MALGLLALGVLAGCGSSSGGSSAAGAAARSPAPVASEAAPDVGSTPMPKGSSYVDYAVYRVNPAAYASRRVALFFWASWCPICQGDDTYIRGTIASGDFPRDLTIVKADYDVETALEQKYGVTSQATFVLVDTTGKALAPPVVPETPLDILTLRA